VTTTLRFFALPEDVVFEATGFALPFPVDAILTPRTLRTVSNCCRYRATVTARASLIASDVVCDDALSL